MKIYLASSWKNSRQPDILAALRSLGHSVYDFHNPAPQNHGFHWTQLDPGFTRWTSRDYQKALEKELACEGFTYDSDAMRAADACVLLLPCGRSAHLEAGWMKGAGKKLYILLQKEDEELVPELMYKLADQVCADLEELLMTLRRSL